MIETAAGCGEVIETAAGWVISSGALFSWARAFVPNLATEPHCALHGGVATVDMIAEARI